MLHNKISHRNLFSAIIKSRFFSRLYATFYFYQTYDANSAVYIFLLHKNNKAENTSTVFSPEQKADIRKMFKDRNKSKCLSPFYQGEGHMNPFFRITQKEYLELLDWSGREIRSDKKGSIPLHLIPIFDRLDLDRDQWIESLKNYDKCFTELSAKFQKPGKC